MPFKLAAFSFFLALLVPVQSFAETLSAVQLGAVVKTGKQVCFRTSNANLSSSDTIMIIDPEDKTTTAVASIVGKKAKCSDTANDSNNANGYSLHITSGKLSDKLIGIGIVNGNKSMLKNMPFHSCSSADGIHLTAWSGAPLTSQRIWHSYVYLNQDLDADCTDTETQ